MWIATVAGIMIAGALAVTMTNAAFAAGGNGNQHNSQNGLGVNGGNSNAHCGNPNANCGVGNRANGGDRCDTCVRR